jgi:hypothetical protein
MPAVERLRREERRMTRAVVTLALLLTAALAHSPSALGMTVVVDGDRVVMSGAVVGGECGQLTLLLQQSVVRTVVLTHSHGGDEKAGICVGELIRAHGLNTEIRGFCNSSCSLMWLGGVLRTLHGKNARVGLHGSYRRGILESPALVRSWISTYAPVNQELMAQWTMLPTKDDMMYFYNDHAKLCESGQCTQLPRWNAVNAGLATR